MKLLALSIWLVPTIVNAGLIRRQATDDLDDPPCKTYTLSGLLHLDCSHRGLKELPNDLDYNVSIKLADVIKSILVQSNNSNILKRNIVNKNVSIVYNIILLTKLQSLIYIGIIHVYGII